MSGAESGSQKILDAMDKGTTVKQIYTATRLMQKHGIKPCLFLQFGYLDELQTDIDLTIKMVFDLMPYDIGVSVSYPLPGTQFYEKVKSQLQIKQNWSDSDELLLMYKSILSAVIITVCQCRIQTDISAYIFFLLNKFPPVIFKPAEIFIPGKS